MSAIHSLARFSGEGLGDSLEQIVTAPNGRDGQRLARWLARRLAGRREIASVDAVRPELESWCIKLSVSGVVIAIDIRAGAASEIRPGCQTSHCEWELEVLRPAGGATEMLRAERTAAWLKTCWAVHDELARAKPLRGLVWVGAGKALATAKARTTPF